MIDSKGYRLNVGMIICNDAGQVFWAKRKGMNAWQFPQGGIYNNETPQAAMYRELREETGLLAEHVRLLCRTRHWLQYKLPKKYIRKTSKYNFIGQKQIWYLVRLISDESKISFNHCEKQEFDSWKWVDYAFPPKDIVYFKHAVYKKAMVELKAGLSS